jgi:hypothetical protein
MLRLAVPETESDREHGHERHLGENRPGIVTVVGQAVQQSEGRKLVKDAAQEVVQMGLAIKGDLEVEDFLRVNEYPIQVRE